MCAAAGELRTVVGLVDWGGADVAAKDKEGCTSLFLASLNGHAEVVEFLLARGAPTEAIVQTHAKAPGTALHAGTSCIMSTSYRTARIAVDTLPPGGCSQILLRYCYSTAGSAELSTVVPCAAPKSCSKNLLDEEGVGHQ